MKNKPVKIAVVIQYMLRFRRPFFVVLLVLLTVGQVFPQEDTLFVNNKLELEKVVISGSRSPMVYSRLSRIVGSLAATDLETMPVSTLQGALEQVSGIDVRQRGAGGIQGDLSIRGSSFDQNLILLNGIDVTDPQTGHFALNLPVNIADVKGIEVLKGSGSRRFGPNAFGGVVNFITAPGDTNYLEVRTIGGCHWYNEAAASSNLAFKGSKHYLSVSRSQSNGFVENTDFLTYNLFYHGNINVKENQLSIQLGYKDKGYGAQSFYTPEYPHQYENIKTSLVSIGMNAGDEIKFEPVVYWRRHQDRFELFREGGGWYQRENAYFVRGTNDTAKYQPGIYKPWNYYAGHNHHLTDVYGSKVNASFQTIAGETSLGFDFRAENIWSNMLGEPMSDSIPARGSSYGFYDKEYSRTIMNYFLEHNFYLGGLSVSAGVLGSWSNEFDIGWKLYPGIDLSFQMTTFLKVYGSYNYSLRLPTFTDLFYSGPSNVGNPDLTPERVNSYEGGVKLQKHWMKGHAAFFYSDAENVIAWARQNNNQTRWKTQNLTAVSNRGVEFSISAFMNRLFAVKLPVRKIRLHYTHIDQDKITGGFESKYSLNYLNHDLGIYLEGGWTNWTVGFSSSYTDRAGSYMKYNLSREEYTGLKDYQPAWLFDGKVNYQQGEWNVFLELSNILDNKHDDIGNVRTPGRWVKIGLKKRFNLDV